jgi:CBS domain-containing protein
VQASDIMTREVVTVGPESTARDAADVMAARGFAALPVVDDRQQLIGIVSEADVLRHRMPPDPRRPSRRQGEQVATTLGLLVRDVMTEDVRSIDAKTDVANLACLLVEHHLRSIPVIDRGELVGIVSRRDLLHLLVRTDAEIREEVLRLVEAYTGHVGCWDVTVTGGLTTIRRTRGAPQVSRVVEEITLQRLAATVPGVVGVRVLTGTATTGASADASS